MSPVVILGVSGLFVDLILFLMEYPVNKQCSLSCGDFVNNQALVGFNDRYEIISRQYS